MFKLLISISILIAFVGADFNFQDSEFNRLIFEDLTEASLEPLRYKRGVKSGSIQQECRSKKGEKDIHCCSGGKADPKDMEAMKEVKAKCIEEVSGDRANDVSYDPLNCDGVQSMRQKLVCVGECLAKKFDLITETGDLKRDAMLNHTRKMIGDNQWKAGVLEEYVDKCLGELIASKLMTKTDVQESCNTKPIEFHHCIWKQFVEGCPVELQIDSKKCRKLRARLANGDTSQANKAFKQKSHHRY